MTSILVCCTPAQGHVGPLLAIAGYLAEAGHDVRFISGRAYEARIRAAGLAFIRFPPRAISTSTTRTRPTPSGPPSPVSRRSSGR